jgi:hypothetical protein
MTLDAAEAAEAEAEDDDEEEEEEAEEEEAEEEEEASTAVAECSEEAADADDEEEADSSVPSSSSIALCFKSQTTEHAHKLASDHYSGVQQERTKRSRALIGGLEASHTAADALASTSALLALYHLEIHQPN